MFLSKWQLFFIVLTLIVVLLPGIIASRRIKSADDYNVGGRSAGSVLVAGTILGTIVGGSATIGTAQLGSSLGMSAWWFTLGSGIALIFMAVFYAKPMRDSGLTTVSEFLVLKYGKNAGPVTSLSATAGMFFSVVAGTITSCHTIAAVFGVSMNAAAMLMVIMVAALVFFGGISGSAMAGIFKMIIIFSTIFVGGFWAFMDMGGLTEMHMLFPLSYWSSLFGGGLQTGWYNLISMIVGVISTQTYVQALFSAKDSKTAVKGCLLAAVIAIPVGLPSIVIGMYMHLLYQGMPPVQSLPVFMLTCLPEWLGSIGIAGLLLSSIGSIAGIALGIGTMVSRDIFGDLLGLTDSVKLLWINRFCVLLATGLAILVAFRNLNSLVLEWNFLSMALRGAGVFLPLTLAVFCPNLVHKELGFTAMVAGVLVALTWKLFVPDANNALFPSLAANLIFLVPGMFISWRHQKSKLS